MDSSTKHGHNTYAICRTLPIFSRLPDEHLKNAINASIETYLPELQVFDQALPAHFHRKSKAAWLEFTCVTVHVCNVLSNSCLSRRQATAMMHHIDLLYRVDDFMETLIDAYGIQDISVVFEALKRCFQPYVGSPSALGSKRSRHARRRIDSPVEGVAPIAKPIEFEHDLNDVVERMHCYPISGASEQDRQWYSLELYHFLVAQLEQLDSEIPTTVTPGQLHKWVTNIGARSVGTDYMFAMFTCLVSAEDGGESLWKTASSLYLAQEFAQQISVEFRVLNDVGGRELSLKLSLFTTPNRFAPDSQMRQIISEHHQKLHEGLGEGDVHAWELSSTVAASLPNDTSDAQNSSGLGTDSEIESAYTATSYEGTSTGNTTLGVPSWPTSAQTGSPFECPICFGIIVADPEISWRRNVFEDLPPLEQLALFSLPMELFSTDIPDDSDKEPNDDDDHSSAHSSGFEHPEDDGNLPSDYRADAEEKQASGAPTHIVNTTTLPPLQPNENDYVTYEPSSEHDNQDYVGSTAATSEPKTVEDDPSLEEEIEKLRDMIPAQEDERVARDAATIATDEAQALKAEQSRETPKAGEKSAADVEAEEFAIKNQPLPDQDQDPFLFKDAVGRKFAFPWYLCKSWKKMESFIKQDFLHVDLNGGLVQEGRNDLTGPDGEIILPQDWETIVGPGMLVTMHTWPMPEIPQKSGDGLLVKVAERNLHVEKVLQGAEEQLEGILRSFSRKDVVAQADSHEGETSDCDTQQ
ncbi:hypothetical protein MBLNU13_g00365t2 [Cladosporium sp. NU13]